MLRKYHWDRCHLHAHESVRKDDLIKASLTYELMDSRNLILKFTTIDI